MYRVLTGAVTEASQDETLEDALNTAAGYVQSDQGRVAVVTEDDQSQAVTVLLGGWVYLGNEESK